MGKRTKKKFQSNKMDMACKQTIEHKNEFPSDIQNISKVQDVIETYYNPELPKTDNIKVFLNRSPKYEFCVFLNRTEFLQPAHRFVFDRKEDAIKAHNQCLAIYINEQIEPFRILVNEGKKLTQAQIKRCEELQKLLPDFTSF